MNSEPKLSVFDVHTDDRLAAIQSILSQHPWEFSEQHHVQLTQGATGFIGVLNEANQTYAHIRLTEQRDPVAVIEITSATQDPTTYVQAVRDALDTCAKEMHGPIHLWRHQPFPADLSPLGLTLQRSLVHMQRDAIDIPPTPATPEGIQMRSFKETDLAAFVALNNAAFAHHPDQGGWSLSLAKERLSQDWVEYNAIHLAEEKGKLLAFHWTKPHTLEDGTQAGETYVIGVDPDTQGKGLGKFIFLYGLHAMAESGAKVLDLWVDEAEEAPFNLYQSMGYSVVHRSQCLEGTV